MDRNEPKYWIALAKGTLGKGAHITNARLHVLDLMVEDRADSLPRWWDTNSYKRVRDRLETMIYLLGFAKKEHVTAGEKQPMIWMFIDECERLIEELPVSTFPVETPEEPIEPEDFEIGFGEVPF